MKPTRLTLALLTGLALSGGAQATLFDRGGGLIYDDVLDVTWLQDANYAMTSGYAADGLMTWDEATAWAANLSYGGYDDWRLPAVLDTGTSGCNFAYSGTDCGYNVQTSDAGTSTVYSEMASLYYDTLGNKAYYDTSGVGPQPGWDLPNTGPFQNWEPYYLYWSGLENASNSNYAWGFYSGDGYQGDGYYKNRVHFAWAVRPGDVAAPVPEPETYALLLAGLGLVGVAAKRRRG